MQVRVIENITKEYPDMIKVVVFHEPRYYVQRDSRKRNREEVDDHEFKPTVGSINRTKTLIRDIVLCNDFEIFATFTFNPKKVDSFSYPKCQSVMRRWLHHQRVLSNSLGYEFKYLIVPEQHKSGRWHFHALLKGFKGSMADSKLRTKTLRPVYHLTCFRSGFTTAVEIDSKEGVSNYVTKYITKEFIKMFNHRRFLSSHNLIRPVRTLNSPIFGRTLPLFRQRVAINSDSDEFLLPVLS